MVARSSAPAPSFAFEPRSHVELGERLGVVDFVSAVATSGPKFAMLKNAGAMLELALAQWALSRLSARHGFEVMLTPDLVHSTLLEGCGFSPRGEGSHVYLVRNDSSEEHRAQDLCLVGTSEIPLAGTQAGKHLREDQLPLRLAGFGHCFRAEAGSRGAATKGLYRLHQFSKAEMFVFCHPRDSAAELAKLRAIQEGICEDLGLHWRTIDMFPHELGNPAARKFDVQVYMPSRKGFGEVASISNCTDYQARRLDIRYSAKDGSKGFVHTLNGTAVAIPRIVLAIIETHQRPDGTVQLPACLVPFMGGLTELRPHSTGGGGGGDDGSGGGSGSSSSSGST